MNSKRILDALTDIRDEWIEEAAPKKSRRSLVLRWAAVAACLGVMIAELVSCVRNNSNGYTNVRPKLKFVGLVAILLTFLVFNVFLAGEEGRDPLRNWEIGSVLLHVVLPIMYVIDWFAFDERGRAKWRYVFDALSFPPQIVKLLRLESTLNSTVM